MMHHTLRLAPGADLRGALEGWFPTLRATAAAVVTCVGSLREAALRYADAQMTTRLTGPFEIVSLEGTLSPDGVHLHIAVADGAGRMFGGHVKHGCVVHTTAEIVVASLPGTEFRREVDGVTGYPELVIRNS